MAAPISGFVNIIQDNYNKDYIDSSQVVWVQQTKQNAVDILLINGSVVPVKSQARGIDANEIVNSVIKARQEGRVIDVMV
ncbi:hypothetical protein IJ531_01630 [bacterium]|nr:hypothetical protein [bacterium]